MNAHAVRSNILGVDVSKLTMDAAFVGAQLAGSGVRPASLPAKAFARTPEGVQEMLAWLAPLRVEHAGRALCVVMEATGRFSTELAAWLLVADASIQPAIVNPADAAYHRKSLALRNNTDKLAARALALFGLERNPAPQAAVPKERKELRAISRLRDDLVRERTALKNRLKEPVVSSWVRRREEQRLKQMDKEIARVELQLHKHIARHTSLAEDLKLLMSIPGVGFLTAVVIMAELGDLRQFKRARQLSAFAGLSPQHHESGTSVHGKPRMSKKGNSRVRQALYMASLSAVRAPMFKAIFERIVQAGKQPKAALGAVMRKLLVLMRALSISNTCFDPDNRPHAKAVDKMAPACG